MKSAPAVQLMKRQRRAKSRFNYVRKKANGHFQAQFHDKTTGKLKHLGVFDTDTQARDAIQTHTGFAAGSQRSRPQKRPASMSSSPRKKCCRKSIEEHVKGFGFMTNGYTEENGTGQTVAATG